MEFKNITTADFVRKFVSETTENISVPLKDLFPEALQNFADQLCQKQRENCKAAYWNVANVGSNIEKVFNNILNAEQPKIEEL